MIRAWSAPLMLAVSGGLVACGGSTTGRDSASSPGSDAGAAADHGTQSANPSQGGTCPTEVPSAGEACSLGLDCSYGSSVRPDCRLRWSCPASADGGPSVWRDVSMPCPQAPPGYCPTAQPDASSCIPMINPNERASCEYPGSVICQCACPTSGPQLGCATTESWVCYEPPVTSGCPSIVPNLGTACSVQGTQCLYGDPCNVGGLAVFCRAGVWVVGQAVCSG